MKQAGVPAGGNGTAQIIDCAVHPQVRHPEELREYMREPWRSRPFPRPERYFFPAPAGDYHPDAETDGLPGSDPDLAARRLFNEGGVDRAILVPLTRGLLPDVDLGSAICRATNDWLAATWLGKHNSDGRFYGSIRVNPLDPERAVEEIERWADDPRMVQVAVPMQALHPYGQRQYFSIWQAAARHSLPIAVQLDGGSGVDFWPTAVGYPHHYIEYSALAPVNFAYHLASLVAEGVFDRLPDLRFVFADGGHDMLAPLMWRFDKNWRSTRSETPWTQHLPTSYLRQHVRFCTRPNEGPQDPAALAEWLRIGDGTGLLLFASKYPFWDFQDPQSAFAGIDEAMRRPIMAGNASALYRFDRELVEASGA